MLFKIMTIVTAGIIILFAGCSSIDVVVDYDHNSDFARYKTYAWLMDNVVIDIEDGLMYLELPGDEIRAHVNAGLKKKGFVLEPRIPQFLIVVYLGLKEKVNVTDKGGKDYGSGKLKVEVEVHPEGAVYMDIIDSETLKLVWRGVASKETEDEPTEKAERKNIRKALDKLMDDFPPKS